MFQGRVAVVWAHAAGGQDVPASSDAGCAVYWRRTALRLRHRLRAAFQVEALAHVADGMTWRSSAWEGGAVRGACATGDKLSAGCYLSGSLSLHHSASSLSFWGVFLSARASSPPCLSVYLHVPGAQPGGGADEPGQPSHSNQGCSRQAHRRPGEAGMTQKLLEANRQALAGGVLLCRESGGVLLCREGCCCAGGVCCAGGGSVVQGSAVQGGAALQGGSAVQGGLLCRGGWVCCAGGACCAGGGCCCATGGGAVQAHGQNSDMRRTPGGFEVVMTCVLVLLPALALVWLQLADVCADGGGVCGVLPAGRQLELRRQLDVDGWASGRDDACARRLGGSGPEAAADEAH